MELSEIMFNRRSIRKYNNEEISGEDLKSILQAGLLAPSSRNLHPVEMIVVRDKAMLDSLSRAKTAGAGMLKEASRVIVVIGDHDRSDVWVEDCSIVMTYMLLKATELGISNYWVQCRKRTTTDSKGNTVTSDVYIKELLELPDNYSVLAILSLGISDEQPTPHTADELELSKIHDGKWQ